MAILMIHLDIEDEHVGAAETWLLGQSVEK